MAAVAAESSDIAADAIKLMFKEEVTPAGADKVIFLLAPIVTVVPALVLAAAGVVWAGALALYFGLGQPGLFGELSNEPGL